jgi:arabinogalactan endo-1,4-beta-galactosidase
VVKWLSFCVLLLVVVGASGVVAAAPTTQPFLTGIDSNYTVEMERAGKTWSIDGVKGDPIALLGKAGSNAFRVRLWVGGDENAHGTKAAIDIAKRAKAAGMQPYIVLFLSEEWSDMVKQPAPAAWRKLDEGEKLKAIETYAERTAQQFVDVGLEIDLWEIGNEIDFGICGVFEEEWPKRVSTEYMSQRIWPRMVPIIRAAQAGVLKVRPQAKFILHLAQFANPDWCIAFWKSMLAAQVRVDYAGLSYFPTSPADPAQRQLAMMQKTIAAIHAAIDRSVLICESAYPSRAKFDGQFADWNKPVEGYALDEAGQAKWFADFLNAMRATPACAGVFIWSPEWHGPGLWEPFAWFDSDGKARPVVNAMRR